ncbi:MAG: flagellar basal body L-ring protein FlgH [Pseudobdellovibrionaceae bacterium]
MTCRLFRFAFALLIYTSTLITLSGCTSLGQKFKTWISDDEEQQVVVEEDVPKYSENPNFGNVSSREYKRMTRDQMEKEAELHASAGSLWQMEGQAAYLFAQNKSRRDGDLLSVKVDGTAHHQVSTKVDVIKKLLKRIEEQEVAAARGLASVAEKANPTGQQPEGAPVAPAPVVAAPKEVKEEPFSMSSVPTRIVERLADGNFRVRGSQPFMIGKREYKVIVTGIIRPEDFSDDGVSSDKLLDPQFDVVSIRRKETL